MKVGSASKSLVQDNMMARLWSVPVFALSLLAVPAVAAGGASTLAAKRFVVVSDPAGAEVYLIGGRAGVTPITLNERDIYPNTYPDGQAHLYGKVVLKNPGCKEYLKFVTLDDIGRGLKVKLDCGAVRAAAEPVAQRQDAGHRATDPESRPERRLRQLKVLQELLDEGLITEPEEKTIRKRVLESR